MASEKSFNEKLIDEFRENDGIVGGMFAGRPMMLLTTTGAKSGQQRTHPLVYTTDDDRMVIIASKGGADTNPDWYYNLKANPAVTVEVGAETFPAQATITEGAERKRLFDLQAALMPAFADYEQKTTREIPVIVLERDGA
ncbi:MAG TPA: nitroreductase family deazaflavin-dependent oxidoreductase [Thermomicrobiales bacterium]|nr:nitroreductase family deazaflavin-dependent oxidoreductase [Thermomicrobiales bacterium]